jgi:hypothetical protein
MQLLFGKLISGAVFAFARLGIADVLESGPKTPAEVAVAINADPESVYRLLRATAAVGVATEGPDGKFSQTQLSDALRTNAVPSMRGAAIFLADEWHMLGWGRLSDAVTDGKTVLEKIYGMPIFDYLAKNPEPGAHFDRAMTSMSTLEGPPVVAAYDFSVFQSITDVGGGHGFLLAKILEANPHLQGVLYDAPHVVAGAPSGPLAAVLNRCKLESGNFFESVPAGSDAYIMKHIIHDWPDDLCIKILKHCRAGVNPGGKLLVVDHCIPPGNDFRTSKFMDLEMLLFPGGKERTEAQFRHIFEASGWKLTRVIPTQSEIAVVEGIPA